MDCSKLITIVSISLLILITNVQSGEIIKCPRKSAPYALFIRDNKKKSQLEVCIKCKPTSNQARMEDQLACEPLSKSSNQMVYDGYKNWSYKLGDVIGCDQNGQFLEKTVELCQILWHPNDICQEEELEKVHGRNVIFLERSGRGCPMPNFGHTSQAWIFGIGLFLLLVLG